MRLTTMLLLIALMQVSASTLAQKVSLKHNNSSLKSVLKELKAQTGYNFLYTERQLKNANPVSIQVRNKELSAVLQQLFAEQPLTYELDSKTIVIREKATPRKVPAVENKEPVVIEEGQQQPIRGRVTNEKGDPLTGATIYVLDSEGKHTSIVTVTDRDGNFQLDDVREGVLLEITFMGYTLQTLKAKAQLGNVALQPFLVDMEEVTVSTGYQSLPKERATGSFEIIDQKLFDRQVSINVLDRLDGIANAVLFDKRGLSDNNNITVRGLSSIHASTSPLVVLDNFPYDGSLSNINPNDVENITILKDAAAASIWGVRAGNGVIVITTKKGKQNSPLKIDVNSNVTIGSKPDIFYPSRMTTPDFIELEKYLFEKGHYTGTESDLNYPVLSPVVELLIRARDTPSEREAIYSQIESLKAYDSRKEYHDKVYKKSLVQQFSMNLNGGSDRLTYLLSTGYDRNNGSLNGDFQRLTLRSNNSYKITGGLSLDVGVFYTQTRSKLGSTPYENLYFASGKPLYPYAQLSDENGNPLPVFKDYRTSIKSDAEEKGLLDWSYSPLNEAGLVDNVTKHNDILINTGINYSFLDNFRAEIKYQYESSSSNGRNLRSQQSYAVRDLINRYTEIHGDGTLETPIPIGDILSLSSTSMQSQSFRGQLNYNYNDGLSDISAIAGTEIREVHTNGNRGQNYGYNDDILTTSRVDFTTSLPLYFGGSARIPDATSFSDRTTRLRSFFINGAYSYDKRYTVSASARQDGSNLFGVSSNQKLVPLWSVGTAWNLHNEPFYNFETLPTLKLRATYGYNGNMNNSLSALTTIRYSSGNLVNIPYASIANAPNPALRWEKTRVINLGVDFASKGDRISGSLEYYSKKGVDLFGRMLLDQTTGAINPTLTFEYIGNSASMEGKGVDIQLHTLNIQGNFRWASNVLFSYSTNKLTAYNSVVTDPILYVNGGYSVNPIIGRPLYAIFSYRWAGLDGQGDPLGYLSGEQSKDYTAILNDTNAEELVYNGPAMPTTFGAFRNTLGWKDFSVSFNITYRLGYHFMRNSINYNSLFNNYASHGDYAFRWQNPGDEATTSVPSMVYPNDPRRDSFYGQSSALIEKGDHIRLQDINMSYTWTNRSFNELPFSNIQSYIYINNIGILWRANKHGLDPDYVVGLPAARTFSFGLRFGLK